MQGSPVPQQKAFGRWLCTANLRYTRDMLVAMEAILCAFERSASVLFLRRIRGEMCKRVAVLERIRRWARCWNPRSKDLVATTCAQVNSWVWFYYDTFVRRFPPPSAARSPSARMPTRHTPKPERAAAIRRASWPTISFEGQQWPVNPERGEPPVALVFTPILVFNSASERAITLHPRREARQVFCR